ncbi:MAG: hypothetical protein ING89_15395 [Rubrivivax sp.]|nr:hypothetical protein [Rubrivivax sp.]
MIALDRAQPLPVLRFGREVAWDGAAPAAPAHWLLTVCDASGLDAACALAMSLDLNAPGPSLVLHLINPTRLELGRARLLSTMLERTRLLVSVEHAELGGLEEGGSRAWIESAGIVRMAELLGEFGGHALCVPAEAIMLAPLQAASAWPALAASEGVWAMRADQAIVRFATSLGEQLAHAVTPMGGANAAAIASKLAPASGLQLDPLSPGFVSRQTDVDCSIWRPAADQRATDLRYVVLQRLLGSGMRDRLFALRAASEIPVAASGGRFSELVQAARRRLPTWVALFVPRLDQPWGAASLQPTPPSIAQDMLSLRLHWKEFASRLANAIERQGVKVEVFEWPLREIVPAQVDALGSSLAIIPHRSRLDYAGARTPAMFYMQEYYRWVFVVDREGWSAASSAYPVTQSWDDDSPDTPFEVYRRRLAEGSLRSKFGQPPARTREALQAAGDIPAGPYVFLPLQIPHDQSIRFFSGVRMAECVQAWIRFSQDHGVPLVLKPHPASPKAMVEFEALPRGPLLHWSKAGVQDLIENASAVATINSGVGFEALLQLKPVITLGRAEYDCVTIRAEPTSLAEAWGKAQAQTPQTLLAPYRGFVNWFLGRYAVDLSLDDAAGRRLRALAIEIALRAASAPAAPSPTLHEP